MKKGSVLFVCGGNVYRSQIAEYIFRKMFPGRGVSSAGLKKTHAGKTVRLVWKETHLESVGTDLKKVGIDILGNKCKLVTKKSMENAYKVFVMEDAQKKILEKRYPAFARKIFVLGKVAMMKNPTMPDLPVDPDAIKTAKKIKKALQTIKKMKLLEK
jgi:protein-tyrosine-phosphatase